MGAMRYRPGSPGHDRLLQLPPKSASPPLRLRRTAWQILHRHAERRLCLTGRAICYLARDWLTRASSGWAFWCQAQAVRMMVARSEYTGLKFSTERAADGSATR